MLIHPHCYNDETALKPTAEHDSLLNNRSSQRVRWYVWATLAFVVLRLWIQPMNSSFWLDETGTFLLVQGTFGQMLERCVNWVGQPTFFAAIVWLFAQLPGPREVILRLPSLIGLSVATFFVYRIGRRVLGSEAAGSAVLIFAALAGYYASDARPYALGLMTASGTILFLIRWMENGRVIDAIGYSVFAALTVYFHFLFSVMFVVHAAYVLLRTLQRKRPRPAVLVSSAVLILILLIPLVPSFLRTFSVRGSFNFVEKPRMASIVLDSVPAFLDGFLVAGIFAVILLFANMKFSRSKVLQPEVWLLLMWAVASPLALFLISYLSPVSVFLPRYFSVALPGLALALAWVISGFQPASARTILTLVLVAGAIADRGGSLRNLPHGNENWREAMAAVRRVTGGDAIPVLVRSEFIESASPAMFNNPGQAEFLLAPQIMYPPAGVIIPLSRLADDRAFERLESIVDQILLRGNQFVLVGATRDSSYRLWLQGRLQSSSFSNHKLGNFGSVSVDLFERK